MILKVSKIMGCNEEHFISEGLLNICKLNLFSLKTRRRKLRLSDKWYVRQIKQYNFINCSTMTHWASWKSDKLHGLLFLMEAPCLFAFD